MPQLGSSWLGRSSSNKRLPFRGPIQIRTHVRMCASLNNFGALNSSAISLNPSRGESQSKEPSPERRPSSNPCPSAQPGAADGPSDPSARAVRPGLSKHARGYSLLWICNEIGSKPPGATTVVATTHGSPGPHHATHASGCQPTPGGSGERGVGGGSSTNCKCSYISSFLRQGSRFKVWRREV